MRASGGGCWFFSDNDAFFAFFATNFSTSILLPPTLPTRDWKSSTVATILNIIYMLMALNFIMSALLPECAVCSIENITGWKHCWNKIAYVFTCEGGRRASRGHRRRLVSYPSSSSFSAVGCRGKARGEDGSHHAFGSAHC